MNRQPTILIICLFLVFCYSNSWANEINEGIYRLMMSNCNLKGKGYIQTGFRASWRGQEGIITALHGVAGCKKWYAALGKDEFFSLKLEAVDIDRDIAFLVPRESSIIRGKSLPVAKYNIANDQLEIVGYPNGTLRQFKHLLEYHENALTPFASWHRQLQNLCAVRKSPKCNTNVLLVRGDPLSPGHSGAPVFNQYNKVVGIGSGGLKGGWPLLNWIIPYTDIKLKPADDYTNELAQLSDNDFTELFALPESMGKQKLPGGKGATIYGKVLYGGYRTGNIPLGPVSNYSKAYATIQLFDRYNNVEVPIAFEYNNQTGEYSIYNVPSGQFQPWIRLESGFPYYKKSAGDFTSSLSGLNKEIPVPPHEKSIHRDLYVTYNIHLIRPVDNQKERTFVGDPPEKLYESFYHPNASVFEWEPVPGATRYEVYISLNHRTTNKRLDLKKFETRQTRIRPNLKVNKENTYYMFSVTAYKGNNWNDYIGGFRNFYKNGHGGWFEFKVISAPHEQMSTGNVSQGLVDAAVDIGLGNPLKDKRVSEAVLLIVKNSNLERAKGLMAEAGWPNGFSFHVSMQRFTESGGTSQDLKLFQRRLRNFRIRIIKAP